MALPSWWPSNSFILAVLGVTLDCRTGVLSIIGIAVSTTTDAALKFDLVLAGGPLYRWLSIGQLTFVVASIARQPRYACLTLLCLWRHDKTLLIAVFWVAHLIAVAVATMGERKAAAIEPLLWMLGPMARVHKPLIPSPNILVLYVLTVHGDSRCSPERLFLL